MGHTQLNAVPLRAEDHAAAKHLYDKVLQTANHFMYNCKHFSISVLQDEDPSYAEVADIMDKVAGIITLLADEFDPMMGQKAIDYCDLMKGMGAAIRRGDELQLARLVAELERKPGV